AIRILGQKGFKAADLSRGVRLPRSAYVGVVLGRVLHLFLWGWLSGRGLRWRGLRWRGLCWRSLRGRGLRWRSLRGRGLRWRSLRGRGLRWRSLRGRRLSWRGRGLSDGGNRGYQQHRENYLL